MKKILLGIVILGLLFVAALGAVGFYFVHKIGTPEFKASLLDKVKQAAGTNVDVKDMDISLLSGVNLKGLRVDNPPPFKGPFLVADEFVLHYKLRPLLSGRVEVERLSLVKPVIALSMDGKGHFNYEKIGDGGTTAPVKGTKDAPSTSSAGGVPLTLVLSKLSVDHAEVSMTDAANVSLLKVDDANFTSAFELSGASAHGTGQASIKSVSMADMLFLRDVKTTLDAGSDEVKLQPLRSKLAGGEAGGGLVVHLKNGMKYTMNLEVKDADVKTLIQEAKSGAGVEGKLEAKATFEGTGGMETMKGKGQARVTGCKVSNQKVLQMISSVLRVPELANPDFKECLVEFQMNGNNVSTPVLNLKGAAIQITGHGSTNLAKSTLDYELNLALANSLLDKMPAKELRAAFKDRGDGFGATDFKVWGSSLNPQNDLASRVGKAAATEAAKSEVKKLFGGKKLF